ncbi:MAG: CdaR family protein [Desulfobacterales bacterium]
MKNDAKLPVKTIRAIFISILVFLIFIVWPYMYSREAVVTAFIQPENVPPGLMLLEKEPVAVEVTIKGMKRRVDSVLKQSPIACRLDFAGARKGINTIPLTRNDFSLPKGVDVVSIHPSSLVFKIDQLIKKSLPIDVTFSGKPAAGHIIADAVAVPAEAILRGPESILSVMQVIETKPVDVTGAGDSIKKKVMANLPEKVEMMFPKDGIDTAVYIEDNIVVKEIKNVKVRGNGTGFSYSITPPVIQLTIKGSETLLEQLSTTEVIEVFLDLENLKPGVYVRHATIRLPVNVTLLDVEPEIFTVKLEKEQGE